MSIIEVPIGSNPAPAVVRAEIEHALGPAICELTLKIDVTRVILYGITDSSGSRARAAYIARKIRGVSDVTNYLQVCGPSELRVLTL
jgi:hypothetical protein